MHIYTTHKQTNVFVNLFIVNCRYVEKEKKKCDDGEAGQDVKFIEWLIVAHTIQLII